jgi:hypothetical protein
MDFDQTLNALQNSVILRADQYHVAVVPARDQPTNELHTVHSRHLNVQKDQVLCRARSGKLLQCPFTAVASDSIGITESFQHPPQQLEHERIIVD